ncbi:hypothetical protein [Persephonella sp.]
MNKVMTHHEFEKAMNILMMICADMGWNDLYFSAFHGEDGIERFTLDNETGESVYTSYPEEKMYYQSPEDIHIPIEDILPEELTKILLKAIYSMEV